MTGETAAARDNLHPAADRHPVLHPVSEWMRWNDVASTADRLRPSLDLSGMYTTPQSTPEPSSDEL